VAEAAQLQLVALTEGDLDRIVVRHMLGSTDADVYPRQGETKERQGKDAAIALVAARLRNRLSHRLLLALDVNGGTADDLRREVERRLQGELGPDFRSAGDRPNVFLHGQGEAPARMCLWAIGLVNDPALHALGIRRHSVEDLIIKALHVPECLDNLVRSERTARLPAGGDPWTTVSELLKVARASGFPVDSSKGVLRMFLSLLGVGASLATIGQKVLRCAQGTPAQAVFDRPPAFELP
jgi:hypothetical protein